jgi:hypothetical protein
MALLEKTKALEERLAAMEDQQVFQNPSPPNEAPDLIPSDFSDSPRTPSSLLSAAPLN